MDMAMAFILRLQSSACRYRVRYTREVESEGDMRGRKGELQIDKVEGQKDFPKKNLEDAGAVGCVWGGAWYLRAQPMRDFGSILVRWGSDRREEADQKKRPLLNSYGWVAIEAGYVGSYNGETTKWQNWRPIQQRASGVGIFGSISSATTGDG